MKIRRLFIVFVAVFLVLLTGCNLTTTKTTTTTTTTKRETTTTTTTKKDATTTSKVDATTISTTKAHSHSFEEEWTYDETHHWHKANCGHDEEIEAKDGHAFTAWAAVSGEFKEERSCSVCEYKEERVFDSAFLIGTGSYLTGDKNEWNNDSGVKLELMNNEPSAREKYVVSLDLKEGDVLMVHIMSTPDRWYGFKFIKGVVLKADNPTEYDGAFLSSIGDNNIQCVVEGNYTFYVVVWDNYAVDIYAEVNSFALHEHSYSEEWSHDATHHYHEATCSHTGETKDKEEHKFTEWSAGEHQTRSCSVCGYEESREVAPQVDDAFMVGYGSFVNGSDWANNSGVQLTVQNDNPDALEKYTATLDLAAGDCFLMHLMSTPDSQWHGYSSIDNGCEIKTTHFEPESLGSNNIKVLKSGTYTIYYTVWKNYSASLWFTYTEPVVEDTEYAYIVGVGSFATENWSNNGGVKMEKLEVTGTEYAKFSATVTFAAGDEFGIRYMSSNASVDGIWNGGSCLQGACDLSGLMDTTANFKVIEAGSYTIYFTVWNNESYFGDSWINKNAE